MRSRGDVEKLVSERKNNIPRVVTKEEGKCWTPWRLKIWWQDFSQLSSIRLVYNYSGGRGVSSLSFGLVAFWYMRYLCCFHIHDLDSFFKKEFNSLGGKGTFSMLWNQLCSMEMTCFYFLFVPVFVSQLQVRIVLALQYMLLTNSQISLMIDFV